MLNFKRIFSSNKIRNPKINFKDQDVNKKTISYI